jgi:hypothetical protein
MEVARDNLKSSLTELVTHNDDQDIAYRELDALRQGKGDATLALTPKSVDTRSIAPLPSARCKAPCVLYAVGN